MLFRGERCDIPLLPACTLAGGRFSIPIRSWVLHVFHDGGTARRWARDGERATAIGPVPCTCLQQFVAEPFLLERTRLQYMRGFTARCVDLPPNVTLDRFLERPNAHRQAWRAFSFGAAHDALRLGAEPSLRGAPLDDTGELDANVRRVQASPTEARKRMRNTRPAGYSLETLRPAIPPLLSPHRVSPLPILPLARCDGGCADIGWCEAVAAGGRRAVGHGRAEARCGCYDWLSLRGSWAADGASRCDDPRATRADLQPSPHWGPACFLNCSGRGECDWQGFCRCADGWYGLDCALRTGADGRPEVDVVSLEARAADADAARGRPPAPLTPLSGLLERAPRRAEAARRAEARRGGRLLYVVDTPPLLRFGADFAGHVEHSLL